MRKHFSNKTRQHTKGEKMVWSQMKPEDLQRKSKGLNKEILKKVLLFFLTLIKYILIIMFLATEGNLGEFTAGMSHGVSCFEYSTPNQNKILSL